MKFTIIPYDPAHEEALVALENEAAQGDYIKIKMLKPNATSRARVFTRHIVLVALDEHQNLAGMLSAGKTKIEINHKVHEPFCMFDARVGMNYRGNRLAHQMIQSLLHQHNPFDTDNFIVTLKSNNREVKSNIKKDYSFISQTGFVYLTIPTAVSIRKIRTGKEPDFQVDYFDDGFPDVRQFERKYDSMAVWNTYKMYALQISHMPAFMNIGVRLANFLRPSKKLPTKERPIEFGSVFAIDGLKINDVNSALNDLANSGIAYLNLCCRRGDYLYNTFQSHAISKYDYILAGMHEMDEADEADEIKIDVRCI